MKIDFKNESGSALAYVIIVMAVMAILGTTALSTSLANTKFAIRDEKSLNAYYVAKAGIDAVSKALLQNNASIKAKINDAAGISGTFGEGSYVVKVTSSGGQVKLLSTGTISSGGMVATKSLSMGMKEFSLATGIFDNVIYNDSTTTLNLGHMSNATLKGSVKSRGAITDFAGNVNTVTPNSGVAYSQVSIPNLTVKSISANSITESGDYGDVSIGKGQVLTIDASATTSANPMKIVFEDLNCDGSIEITKNASGKAYVYLFIEKTFYLGANNNNKDANGLINANVGSDPSSLSVFLKGDDNSATVDFEIKGGVMKGLLYAPTAVVLLHNKAQLTGAIVAGTYQAQAASDKDYLTYMMPDASLDYSGVIAGGYTLVNYSEE